MFYIKLYLLCPGNELGSIPSNKKMYNMSKVLKIEHHAKVFHLWHSSLQSVVTLEFIQSELYVLDVEYWIPNKLSCAHKYVFSNIIGIRNGTFYL